VIRNNCSHVCCLNSLSIFFMLCTSTWQLSATFDILIQAKYAEIMRNHPGVGTSITTFKLFFSRLGRVVVQSFVGPLSDEVRTLEIYFELCKNARIILFAYILTNDPASLFLCCL
jgi:hypothetical protein